MRMKISRLIIFVVMLLSAVAYPQSEGGFSLQVEVDPANTFSIIDNHEEGFNGALTVNYRKEFLQIGAFYETFPKVEYHSFGIVPYIVLNHEGRFNYLGGVTLGFISRPTAFSPTIGVNGQIQYNLGKLFLSARGEYKTRGDIDKMTYQVEGDTNRMRTARFSTFVGIGIKF